jgi:hypothetical protein
MANSTSADQIDISVVVPVFDEEVSTYVVA